MFWRLGILGLLGLAGAFLYWTYTSTLAENQRLTTELQNANAAILALDETIARRDKILENERTVIDEIEHSPAGDDGPIAPVLRRTIERLSNDG